MSIWGKLVGGVSGLALGGPLGALLGALAGHALDRVVDWNEQQRDPDRDETQGIAFTIGVIALGAKMAKVDGRVTYDEVTAFQQVFRVPPDELANVSRIFDQAKRDAAGFEPYAAQLARLLKDKPAVLEEVLDCLFHIARADGHIVASELEYLAAVARIFGFDDVAFRRISTLNGVRPADGAEPIDPYEVLGIPADTPADAIRATYLALVREHHPDRLMAEGLPPEFVTVASRKLARINVAYDMLSKHHGLT